MHSQAKSDAAWRELLAHQVRQHSRLWFRLSHDILHDAHAAEDACQQALLQSWMNRDRLRDATQLRSWLARTVINESLLRLRRSRTERRVLDKQSREETRSARPEDALSARETALMGLEALPEPLRTVVALRIMEGFSGNEVKDILQCSASQVSRLLHEGLEQLRTTLDAKDVAVNKEGSHDVH